MEEEPKPVSGGAWKVIAGILILLVVVAAAGFFLFGRKDNQSAKTASHTENQSFTAADVAAHKTASDCWTIINGNVYDLTSFIPRHPGGSEILRACGIDGTQLFETRHDENGNAIGSATPHSSSAQSQLDALKIGTLER